MEGRIIEETLEKEICGLSLNEVEKRKQEGKVNKIPKGPSRTLWQIIRANLFNRFNAINIALAIVVIIAGSPKNSIFAFVIIVNTLIGVFQELKAKATLEKLSIINSAKAKVIREGKEYIIPIEEIVLDDLMILNIGDQISADGIVINKNTFEVDETLLTGESDAIYKVEGDKVLSGSFVVSGKGYCRVTKVGKDTYAAKLSEEAKKFKKIVSELQVSVDKILKYIMWLLVPISIGLIFTQIYFSKKVWQEAALGAVAGIVGMVPEGLVLLTSLTFVAGVMRLAKWNTLVQELPATETLARVDMLCLDKTGTLTEGTLKVVDVIPLNDFSLNDVEMQISAFIKNSEGNNATEKALKEKYSKGKECNILNRIAFSSARKWSGISLEKLGAYYMGAPEMLLKDKYSKIEKKVESFALEGKRVLLFAKSNETMVTENLSKDITPIALILIQDRLRKEAPKTLEYFKKQGVNIKIISGDNPITVSAIAKEAGLENAHKCIDARKLPIDRQELAEELENNTVFGRVTPHQKKEFVKALKMKGHTVAMTGDGVNDVLALKESDCGIAMASGSDATKAVAQLVLLNSNFSALPEVVAEGRRMINNIERVAVMFLSKTIYSILLALIFIFALMPFPLLPIQLSLIGSIAIGIPSFFLALIPNSGRVRYDFLRRIFYERSIPNGIAMCLNTTLIFFIGYYRGLSIGQCRTLAVIVLGGISLLLLFTIAKPFDRFKLILVSGMFGLFSLAFIFKIGRILFNLEFVSLYEFGISIILVIISLPLANFIRIIMLKLEKKLFNKNKKK